MQLVKDILNVEIKDLEERIILKQKNIQGETNFMIAMQEKLEELKKALQSYEDFEKSEQNSTS